MTHSPETVLAAIDASIEKWIKNTTAETDRDYKTGRDDCPLCKLFNKYGQTDGDECKGCPIYAHTEQQYCKGTPYYDAEKTKMRWIFDKTPEARLKSLDAAKDMVKYLEGIRIDFVDQM